MAVTNQLTTIHSLDQATDAVTGCTVSGADNNFTSDTGEYVEGSAGFSFDLDAETHTVVFTPSSSLNLTSQNIWIWMMFFTPAFLDTWANGAVKCRLSDGTNYSEWYLGGSTNPNCNSNWTRFVFYTGSTPDAVSGTLSLSAVTTITYYFTGVSKSKLAQNVFIDYLQYGAATDGIKVTGGGVGTEEAFADVYGDDLTAAAGVLQYADGVYYLNGSITFGDTATNNCYFQDTNQIIVSKSFYRSFTTTNRTSAESLVGSSHFTIKVQNYASGTCNFQLGESAGGRGASGCVFKTGGNRLITFDFNDTDIDVLKLYGCLFINCATSTFPTAISGSEVYDSIWNGCGEVEVETFKFRYCNFVNATSNAIQVDSTSFDVQYCNFINPTTAGVELTYTGTYSFVSMNFVGTSGSGPYDVNNTSGGACTVQNDANSNAAYYTGTLVTFQSTKTVSVHVQDPDQADLSEAQVCLRKVTEDEYTSTSGNSQGDLDFVVSEALATDINSAGWIDVQDVSTGKQHSYRYSSVSAATKTFTLRTKVSGTCEAGGSATLLVDTGIGAMDVMEGDTIRNETDGSWATILRIETNQVTTTDLLGGTTNTWATGQTWSVHSLAVTYTTSDKVKTPILNENTDSNGDVSMSYNYQSTVDIVILVRKANDWETTKYKPFSDTGQITTSGYTRTVTMQLKTVGS